ncbi:MAG: type II toxin-antitoxin system Phd/YefM family antitoxin [Sulfurospirillaceae bacterium]|nr:type II toxin-antitoxin system Phd/YefM family antitoxin [Sulfurospirillaceae bacterium]
MISYTQDEIVSATDAVRNFSSVLKSISSKTKEKVVIVKNNRFEAVVLSVEKYEKMEKAVEILENIYNKTKMK